MVDGLCFLFLFIIIIFLHFLTSFTMAVIECLALVHKTVVISTLPMGEFQKVCP